MDTNAANFNEILRFHQDWYSYLFFNPSLKSFFGFERDDCDDQLAHLSSHHPVINSAHHGWEIVIQLFVCGSDDLHAILADKFEPINRNVKCFTFDFRTKKQYNRVLMKFDGKSYIFDPISCNLKKNHEFSIRFLSFSSTPQLGKSRADRRSRMPHVERTRRKSRLNRARWSFADPVVGLCWWPWLNYLKIENFV